MTMFDLNAEEGKEADNMHQAFSAVKPAAVQVDVAEILLFDSVYMMSLDNVIEALSGDPARTFEQAGLLYLRERGFLRSAPGTVSELWQFLDKPLFPAISPKGQRGGNFGSGSIRPYGTTLGYRVRLNAPHEDYFLLENAYLGNVPLPQAAARFIAMTMAERDKWSFCGSNVQFSGYYRGRNRVPLFQLSAKVDRWMPDDLHGDEFLVDFYDASTDDIVWVSAKSRGVEVDIVWRDGEYYAGLVPNLRDLERSPQGADNILDVVLQAMPIPASDLPFDELLDIKVELASQLTSLHLWIRDIFFVTITVRTGYAST